MLRIEERLESRKPQRDSSLTVSSIMRGKDCATVTLFDCDVKKAEAGERRIQIRRRRKGQEDRKIGRKIDGYM